MHLTQDELVGPLREECSFLPSPGASLNQFASGTAKDGLLNFYMCYTVMPKASHR